MSNAVASGGLGPDMARPMIDGSANNPLIEINDDIYITENKGNIFRPGLTPEQLQRLAEKLPEGYLAELEALGLDGNTLPLQAAEIANENPLSAFSGLFALLYQVQQDGVASGGSQGDKIEPPILTGDSNQNAGIRELVLRLRAAIQGQTSSSGAQLIAADFPEDLEAISAFLLHKAAPNAVAANQQSANRSLMAAAGSFIEDELPTGTISNRMGNDVAAGLKTGILTEDVIGGGKTAGTTQNILTQLTAFAGKILPSAIDPGSSVGQVTPLASGITASLGLGDLSTAKTTLGSAPAALTANINDKGWDSMLGNRLMWMVGKQMQSAALKITPPNMGPIDIKVAIQNDQASVSFVAQHGLVREALEMAIPRLKEMFGESNLQLVNVDVGQRESGDQSSLQSFTEEAQEGFNSAADGGDQSGEGLSVDTDGEMITVTTHDGLLDDYA